MRNDVWKNVNENYLVDLRDVVVDTSLPIEDRVQSYINQIKNPYCFKVRNNIVQISYANEQVTFNECMVNLLDSM